MSAAELFYSISGGDILDNTAKARQEQHDWGWRMWDGANHGTYTKYLKIMNVTI